MIILLDYIFYHFYKDSIFMKELQKEYHLLKKMEGLAGMDDILISLGEFLTAYEVQLERPHKHFTHYYEKKVRHNLIIIAKSCLASIEHINPEFNKQWLMVLHSVERRLIPSMVYESYYYGDIYFYAVKLDLISVSSQSFAELSRKHRMLIICQQVCNLYIIDKALGELSLDPKWKPSILFDGEAIIYFMYKLINDVDVKEKEPELITEGKELIHLVKHWIDSDEI